ncbi:hypothetical protein [Actinomadura opuntiae]|uniref:hypothetical protein n=1 Tax=Actinomadura sp. OS1-43 TaxID=604315 RepID=UPI00255ADEF9|nr:hypothetical protein [Actinomadura sp. OS1-43]MDL4812681.1 hypothetical protein [Actinomadura sp. OS1-43]
MATTSPSSTKVEGQLDQCPVPGGTGPPTVKAEGLPVGLSTDSGTFTWTITWY